MTKKCEILINNSEVTVADYDGNLIQFPSIHKEVEYLMVSYDDGVYSIVHEIECKTSKKDKTNIKSQ